MVIREGQQGVGSIGPVTVEGVPVLKPEMVAEIPARLGRGSPYVRRAPREAGAGSHHGPAAPCPHQGQCTCHPSDDLVRHARI
jgi:hypothetical protein